MLIKRVGRLRGITALRCQEAQPLALDFVWLKSSDLYFSPGFSFLLCARSQPAGLFPSHSRAVVLKLESGVHSPGGLVQTHSPIA